MIRPSRHHPTARLTRGYRLVSVWASLCILFLGCALESRAQFSGPATSSTATYNQELTATTDRALLYPGERDIVLTIGDEIAIRLFSDAKYNPQVRINNDGTVLLPLIGIVHIEGLSVTQAERLIAQKLEDAGMYRNPQVTLQITEGPNAVVTVIGEVHAVVPVVGTRHLLDVLSTTGGLPLTASHVITINRPGVAKPLVVDLGTDPLLSSLGNIPVFPGDVIVVSRIGIVYMLGSFSGALGTIPLNAYTPLTLTEATALAGGIKWEGRFGDLRIIRTVGDHRTVAVYNIKKVLDGKVPDPILQPNDIVYLPPVPLKQFLTSGGLGTTLGTRQPGVCLALTGSTHVMTDPFHPSSSGSGRRKVRLAYLVSHPIQYQAPLLRRIALEPDLDLTVLFGSDFSVRGYKDRGFGVEVAWDTPLLDGYHSEFLHPWRDTGEVSPTSPINRGIFRRLQQSDGTAAFDALWVHGYASINALQAILAANALGIPVLLRAESWLADRVRKPLETRNQIGFLQAPGQRDICRTSIGTVNAAYWTHYFGTGVPQYLMPYAVNNEYFAELAATAAHREHELRAELELSAGRPVILFASKLQQRKHADHLLEAYSRLIADITPQKRPYLVVVGDGEHRAQLELQAQQLGLEDVRFAGFRNQSELPRFFQLADVFVLPSRHEPWGLIVNESMASGCPVIVSTDVGCHADLITDGVEGCVFPVGDILALTQALRKVFSSPDTAARMGEAARRRIKTWTYEEDVQGLRRALAEVTRSSKDC